MSRKLSANRLLIAAATVVGLATASSVAAAQSVEERCSNQAWVSCQTDEFGNPTFVTVECFDREYQACIESSGGGGFGAFREE